MAEAKKPSTGTVNWFSAQKGFGFIAPDDGGEDLFVHQTTILSDGFRTLSEGQPVEFFIDLAEDGRAKAVDVVAISRSRRPVNGRGGRGARRSSFDGRIRREGGGGGDRSRGGGSDDYGRGNRGDRFGSGGGGGDRGRWGGSDEYGRGNRGDRLGTGGGVGTRCYSCGRIGHMARDCYRGAGGDDVGGRRYDGGGGRRCYNCGEEGHFARDCPNDGGGGGGPRCYNCGEEGHFARDCPNNYEE